MATLQIDLQDGFVGDDVVVRIDGGEVYRKTGVRTDLRLGLADSFRAPVPSDPGPVEVEVAIPARKLVRTLEIRAHDHPHIGVSISDGCLELRPSAVSFGYA